MDTCGLILPRSPATVTNSGLGDGGKVATRGKGETRVASEPAGRGGRRTGGDASSLIDTTDNRFEKRELSFVGDDRAKAPNQKVCLNKAASVPVGLVDDFF